MVGCRLACGALDETCWALSRGGRFVRPCRAYRESGKDLFAVRTLQKRFSQEDRPDGSSMSLNRLRAIRAGIPRIESFGHRLRRSAPLVARRPLLISRR